MQNFQTSADLWEFHLTFPRQHIILLSTLYTFSFGKRKRSLIHWFTPQMPITEEDGPSWIQQPETQPVFPKRVAVAVAVTKLLETLFAASQTVHWEEAGIKWGQDSRSGSPFEWLNLRDREYQVFKRMTINWSNKNSDPVLVEVKIDERSLEKCCPALPKAGITHLLSSNFLFLWLD